MRGMNRTTFFLKARALREENDITFRVAKGNYAGFLVEYGEYSPRVMGAFVLFTRPVPTAKIRGMNSAQMTASPGGQVP